MSALLRRRRNHHVAEQLMVARSGGLRPPAEALSPLKEGPDGTDGEDSKMEGKWGHWMKGQLCRAPSVSCSSSAYKRSDLRLLLGVLGAPLGPVHVSTVDPLPHLSIKDTPIETSSAQYILQQYTAASGGQKLQNSIHNAYAMGKVKMVASEFETAGRVVKSRNSSKAADSGGLSCGRCIQTCGMWSLPSVAARFMLVAMESLSGGTRHGLVRTLQKGLLDPCAVHFRD